ncbi:uncharacterized protein HaLaN_17218 [Haematococcus lacustris]|uniref:Uncharacterized protein n=1 Tax=Haematococcus lacustris TaxID=44745 RepID=A0A699ZDE1_HAELA|nr:uncharacterized protein HaLaN_17218 [Haematococcus lacustris]
MSDAEAVVSAEEELYDGLSFVSVYHSEGPAAFFRSYRTTLVMNVPFIAMHFSVYDAAKGLLVGGEDGDEDTLLVQLLPVMRRIVQEEGWSALWRGVRPRVLFNAPSAAICWGTYESIKAFLAR